MRRTRLLAALLITASTTGCAMGGPRADQGDIAFCTAIAQTPLVSSQAYVYDLNAFASQLADGRLRGLVLSHSRTVLDGSLSAGVSKAEILARCEELGAL